jgi:hypothetical protein
MQVKSPGPAGVQPPGLPVLLSGSIQLAPATVA